MDRNTSLFLDICRFFAAMIVFLGHASGNLLTGGLFWQFGNYLQTAVIIFFVLSGYVIAFVVDTRENTALDYTVSRLARLYSIVIPALILTLICDWIGLSIDPNFYFQGPWGYPENNMMGYVTSALFLNEIWNLGLRPGINGPFWSLGYEGFYYAFFFSYFFLSGPKRYIVLLALMCLAGPSIISLFPLWIFGYTLYHYHSKFKPRAFTALLFFITGMSVIILSPYVREITEGLTLPRLRSMIIADYSDAMGFGLMIVGFWGLKDKGAKALEYFSRPIRWFASLTFALYLFHRPLIQVLAVLVPSEAESIEQRVIVLLGTFAFVAIIGTWCEKQKTPLKRKLLQLYSSLKPKTA